MHIESVVWNLEKKSFCLGGLRVKTEVIFIKQLLPVCNTLSGFLQVLPTNIGVFFRSLKLYGESRTK